MSYSEIAYLVAATADFIAAIATLVVALRNNP